MTIPAHISGGYIALNIINRISPNLELTNNELMIAGLIGSVLPDIDYVFFKYVKDHHNSWTHTPVFWIAIYIIVLILSLVFNEPILRSYSTALIIGIFTHLFLDWYSGRTTGIRILYPYSKKVFSLYQINPNKGKVSTSLKPNQEHIEFFKFYAKNKFLLFSEIGLILAGVLLVIF